MKVEETSEIRQLIAEETEAVSGGNLWKDIVEALLIADELTGGPIGQKFADWANKQTG